MRPPLLYEGGPYGPLLGKAELRLKKANLIMYEKDVRVETVQTKKLVDRLGSQYSMREYAVCDSAMN
jgi:hypothetical protein